jgi:hypothetical protein
MENIVQFRKALLENFSDLKDGTLKPKEANAMSNTAGKVLSACPRSKVPDALQDQADSH